MQINAQHQALPQMNEQSTKRDKTLDKIAVGIELNMADSASRTIASQMQNNISTFSQEYMNNSDSIGMTQIADGALTNLSESAQKLNDLSVRSNNAGLNSSDQQALQAEFQRTQTSMQDIVNTTSYNQKPLLDSSVSPKNLTLENQDAISSYMSTLSSAQSDIGATANGYISHANTLLGQITQTSAAKSQIADTDIAKTISDFQSSNRSLDASILTSAHQAQLLRKSIDRLLG